MIVLTSSNGAGGAVVFLVHLKVFLLVEHNVALVTLCLTLLDYDWGVGKGCQAIHEQIRVEELEGKFWRHALQALETGQGQASQILKTCQEVWKPRRQLRENWGNLSWLVGGASGSGWPWGVWETSGGAKCWGC